MQSTTKLLLIEDDRAITAALSQALAAHYRIEHAPSGKLGIYKSDHTAYDAIILDLNLPDISGLHVCQQLRERGVKTPILIVTGEHKVLTKINLLDAGANDYLTKPFSLGELKARLRAIMRNVPATIEPAKLLTVGDLSLNSATFEVHRDNQRIQLRRKEFSLLECLMSQPGTVVSRQALTRYAWNANDNWTNTVDVHIKHLRDKIDRPFNTQLIQTVHGIGYRLDVPAQQLSTAMESVCAV